MGRLKMLGIVIQNRNAIHCGVLVFAFLCALLRDASGTAASNGIGTIVIPEQEYRDASLVDVLDFLAGACSERRTSTEERRMHFVYMPSASGVEPVTISSNVPRVSFSATGLTIKDTLDRLARQLGLDWSFIGNAVVMRPSGQPLCEAASAEKSSNDEHAIYRLSLSAAFDREAHGGMPILLAGYTEDNVTNHLSSVMQANLLRQGVGPDTLSSFLRRNGTSKQIAEFAEADGGVILVPRELTRLLADDPDQWAKLYGKAGVFSMSDIGFDRVRGEALVYVAHRQNVLAGRGYMIWLVRVGSLWIVKRTLLLWVS